VGLRGLRHQNEGVFSEPRDDVSSVSSAFPVRGGDDWDPEEESGEESGEGSGEEEGYEGDEGRSRRGRGRETSQGTEPADPAQGRPQSPDRPGARGISGALGSRVCQGGSVVEVGELPGAVHPLHLSPESDDDRHGASRQDDDVSGDGELQ